MASVHVSDFTDDISSFDDVGDGAAPIQQRPSPRQGEIAAEVALGPSASQNLSVPVFLGECGGHWSSGFQ